MEAKDGVKDFAYICCDSDRSDSKGVWRWSLVEYFGRGRLSGGEWVYREDAILG